MHPSCRVYVEKNNINFIIELWFSHILNILVVLFNRTESRCERKIQRRKNKFQKFIEIVCSSMMYKKKKHDCYLSNLCSIHTIHIIELHKKKIDMLSSFWLLKCLFKTSEFFLEKCSNKTVGYTLKFKIISNSIDSHIQTNFGVRIKQY